MLSRQFVRENPEVVREALDNKGVDVDLDRILDVDEEWRELKSRGDDLRHERNEVSSTIGELKQAGEEEEAAQEAIERSQEVKSELQEIEERADELEAELEESLLELPQIPTSRCRSGPTSRRTSSDAARGSTTCARFPTTWSPTTIWARSWRSSTSRARRESRRRRLLRREGRRPAGACADPVHARRASRAGLP